MNRVLAVSLLATTFCAPAGWAQTVTAPVPTPAQIAAAIGTPNPAFHAAMVSAVVAQPSSSGGGCGSNNSMTLTPSMLRCPTRGVHQTGLAAGPAAAAMTAPPVLTVAPPVPTNPNDPCAAGSGVCSLNIPFEFGSAALTPQAIAMLDAIGQAILMKPASLNFAVDGYTDTVGSTQVNKVLSQRRAESARNYLVARYGIAGTRLAPRGWGKEHLLVATGDDVPEPANRRVSVASY